MKPSRQSVNINRLRVPHNRLEARYVQAWREANRGMFPTRGDTHRLLKYLLSPQQPDIMVEPTDRDCQVAETVIQWLGSVVGQDFLSGLPRDSFYDKGKNNKRNRRST